MKIRTATIADIDVLSTVLGEIEGYYGGEPRPGDPGQIRRALFSEVPAATVLLAEEEGEVVGLASYSLLWPASGADTSLYLKELFVRESGRRRGVGRALLEQLRTLARDAGYTRVEWTADADNPPALAFYAALGLEPQDGKILYRTVL